MQEVEYIVSEYKKQIDRLSKDLTEQLSNPKFYDEKGSFNKQRKIALLKNLKDDLLRMDVTSRSFLKTIKGAYTINVEDSLRLFEMITGKKFEGDWNYVDSKDILRLQDEYINYMQQGQEKYYKGIQNQLSAMELENKKYIAEIVKDQANNQIIGGDLRKQSVANIMQKMTEKGMTSFIYADSLGNMRSINLKSYAEIQIRSSIAYATNQAVVDSNEQLENDLVQFSTHYTCCPVCGTYAEGRCYTTNKNRNDYPYLYDIPGFKKGYNSLHPFCRHRITAYYEEYSDNVEEVKKHSNNLTDTRTEAQKKQYDNEQKLNQLRYAKKNNLEKRKSLADSQLDKDKRKIKRLEETSRKYTQRIKEVKESSSKLDIRPVEKVKEVVKKEKIVGVEKGKIMSFEEADGLKPNPNFEKDSSYRVNCQTTVVSYEARRRGFDVEALPNKNNTTIFKLSKDTDMAWIDKTTKEKPKGLSIISKGTKTTYNFLKDNVFENERYTFSFMWKTGKSGHIIHVDKVDNVLRLYDPQSGKLIDNQVEVVRYLDKIKHYINPTVTSYGNKFTRSEESLYHSRPKLLRVDNLDFNMDIVEQILKGSV